MKSYLFGHVIEYALHCSKIATNDSHHFAKRAAPVSQYQNIVPTKYLRNQLGMVWSITIGRLNWCSLTSASPPSSI